MTECWLAHKSGYCDPAISSIHKLVLTDCTLSGPSIQHHSGNAPDKDSPILPMCLQPSEPHLHQGSDPVVACTSVFDSFEIPSPGMLYRTAQLLFVTELYIRAVTISCFPHAAVDPI
jgi:hypothetical protein